jgi:hypothetical protein
VVGVSNNIKSVRAGSYVSACADENGQIWYWGSRGAGMFQPIPRKAELPTGQVVGVGVVYFSLVFVYVLTFAHFLNKFIVPICSFNFVFHLYI